MTTADLHTLSGAYAVGALPGAEAVEFERHLARCGSCAQEVRELRETAARLALAVAEVPPAELRSRVMAALPDVRQLPPEPFGPPVLPPRLRTRFRDWRRRMPQLALAACLALAATATAVAVDARHDADTQRDRTAAAEQRADVITTLLAAPDATFHTGTLTGGGTATVVSSDRLTQAAILYQGLPEPASSKVYELWYSRGTTMLPAGLLDPATGTGSVLLDGDPRGADAVGLTLEPSGGSPTPTSPPLAVVPL